MYKVSIQSPWGRAGCTPAQARLRILRALLRGSRISTRWTSFMVIGACLTFPLLPMARLAWPTLRRRTVATRVWCRTKHCGALHMLVVFIWAGADTCTSAADVWSVGVLEMLMLGGNLPAHAALEAVVESSWATAWVQEWLKIVGPPTEAGCASLSFLKGWHAFQAAFQAAEEHLGESGATMQYCNRTLCHGLVRVLSTVT